MILYNDRIITNSVGKWIQRPLHMVTTYGNHGSVNANPNKGEFGTNVTLSNTPDTGYRFTSYSIAGDGASLSGNTLTIGYSDVSVTGNFEEIILGPSIRAKFKAGYTPTMGDTQILVDSSNNIWDIHRNSNDFSSLFSNCNNLLEVISGDTSSVTNMNSIFKYCMSLTSVALFDTSNVTDMEDMFMRCDSLTSLPLFNTSNVTNMSGMCLGTPLRSIPQFNTSKVTNMSAIFSGCHYITTVPSFDTSKVTNISQMFATCIALETVPLFNTSNVTNMSYMFSDCEKLKQIPLFNTSKVTQIQYAFEDCFKVESGALALYNQMANQTNPPRWHSYCFNDCGRDTTTGAAELAQIPSDWK